VVFRPNEEVVTTIRRRHISVSVFVAILIAVIVAYYHYYRAITHPNFTDPVVVVILIAVIAVINRVSRAMLRRPR